MAAIAMLAMAMAMAVERKRKHDILLDIYMYCKMRIIVGGCSKTIVVVKELLGKEENW